MHAMRSQDTHTTVLSNVVPPVVLPTSVLQVFPESTWDSNLAGPVEVSMSINEVYGHCGEGQRGVEEPSR